MKQSKDFRSRKKPVLNTLKLRANALQYKKDGWRIALLYPYDKGAVMDVSTKDGLPTAENPSDATEKEIKDHIKDNNGNCRAYSETILTLDVDNHDGDPDKFNESIVEINERAGKELESSVVTPRDGEHIYILVPEEYRSRVREMNGGKLCDGRVDVLIGGNGVMVPGSVTSVKSGKQVNGEYKHANGKDKPVYNEVDTHDFWEWICTAKTTLVLRQAMIFG